ncbi:hypothetical protein KUCAC02_021974, partial [Chaenocephalus aceratus]
FFGPLPPICSSVSTTSPRNRAEKLRGTTKKKTTGASRARQSGNSEDPQLPQGGRLDLVLLPLLRPRRVYIPSDITVLPNLPQLQHDSFCSSSAPLAAHRFNSAPLKDTQRAFPSIHNTKPANTRLPTTEHRRSEITRITVKVSWKQCGERAGCESVNFSPSADEQMGLIQHWL